VSKKMPRPAWWSKPGQKENQYCKAIAQQKIERQRPPIDPDFEREIRKLSDLAFVFLDAADGDPVAAERLLDDAMLEGGALQTWRYRILLAGIRAGL
jgi:hypothetical protein